MSPAPSAAVLHLAVAVARLLAAMDKEQGDPDLGWRPREVAQLMSHLEARARDEDFRHMEAAAELLEPALGTRYTRDQLLHYAGDNKRCVQNVQFIFIHLFGKLLNQSSNFLHLLLVNSVFC